MRRILVVLVAAALLVGGGVAVALLANQGSAIAQEDEPTTTQAPAETEAEDTDIARPQRGMVLADVLEDLVADGVITGEQAEEITAAWQTRWEELRTEFEARRGERGLGRHHDFGLRELLEDGVIDADELAELGPDHPFNDPDGPAAEYLEDGQLTQDELAELHTVWRRDRDGAGLGTG